MVGPARKREAVRHLQSHLELSERHAKVHQAGFYPPWTRKVSLLATPATSVRNNHALAWFALMPGTNLQATQPLLEARRKVSANCPE